MMRTTSFLTRSTQCLASERTSLLYHTSEAQWNYTDTIITINLDFVICNVLCCVLHCLLTGRMYELPANLPIDRTLEITVMDHDLLSANDLIGKTTIDLENRYLTKHLALCGLPQSFHKLVNTQIPTRWNN